MGERKGQNKYYPPDFDPSKGSLNSWLGTHPLRDRARKLHKGILVIRFEMPYNIWCDGCNNHIGMGVRYNAEKSKVGNYYTTPIYKFRMKCHLCDNYFEIQTDPKNHDYVILVGARRKEQRWDPHANEQIVPEDKATQKKLATDPMYKLEHGSDDRQRGKETQLTVAQIEDIRDAWNDDYTLNKLARDKFRGEKKQMATAKAADQALLDKSSLDIKLLPESSEDQKMAGLLKYSVTKSFDEKREEKRKAIENRPLFSTKAATATSALILPKSNSSTFSRRAEVKLKLGLHLSSAKAAHAIGLTSPSPTLHSSVRSVAKLATKVKSTESRSNTGFNGPECDSPINVSALESPKDSEETGADDSNCQHEGEEKTSLPLEERGSETSHKAESDKSLPSIDNSYSSLNSSECDGKTGLAALIASYSDSESGNSDAVE